MKQTISAIDITPIQDGIELTIYLPNGNDQTITISNHSKGAHITTIGNACENQLIIDYFNAHTEIIDI